MRSLILVAFLAACGSTPEPAATPEPAPEPAPVETKAPEAKPIGQAQVTTIKKETVQDQHTMDVMSNLALADASDISTLTGSVDIMTNSWTSPIDVRDQRVRLLFFDSAANPKATFNITQVKDLAKVDPGASTSGSVVGDLTILGKSNQVVIPVTAKLVDGHWMVASTAPVEVKASDYGLSDRLTQVAEACGVPLSDTTTVTINLDIPG